MKLYYLIDKWSVDHNKTLAPIYYSGDCDDFDCHSEIKLNVFTEENLFDQNVTSEYEECIDYRKIRNTRVISMYSIETSELPQSISVDSKEFYYTLSVQNTKESWKKVFEGKINCHNYYNLDYHILNWKFEKNVVLNTKKFFDQLCLPNDSSNDIKKLTNIIVGGDHPDRLVRLNCINNKFSDENLNLTLNSAKELYDILYDFTFGDYYDINSDGTCYYRAMEFLRNNYNTDPNHK